MKILMLANSDIGLYKFRKELIQRLIEEKNKVFIALPMGEYIPLLKQMGCIFLKTPIDRRGMNPLKDFKLLLRYKQLVRKIKPDVVLTYTIKPNIYGGMVCRFYHVRYIENITGLGTAIENSGVLSKFLLGLYRISLKSASQVFFQNAANQQYFVNNKIIQKSRLLPGSGVNLEEHCYEEYPKEEDGIHFLFVGRIMKDKGIDELLACAKYFHIKNWNIHFDLIGDYDEEIYKKAIEAMERKGLIRYFGQQKDVHSWIKTHHAIILPSYHEGLSNVLLEAAACGRPVLATRVSGCRETYDEGITGIGFEAGDVKSMILAIGRFYNLSHNAKKKMGYQGRLKIEKEFNRQTIIEAYIQEINQKGVKTNESV